MKAYPITENELGELQGIGLLATSCFSVGSGLIGFSINVHKDLALAKDAPIEAWHWWDGLHYGTFSWGIALVIVGIVAFAFGKTRIRQIKRETEFDA